ncbi:MAG: hypothetical protein M3Y82_11400, partial [Verrucomicrobiota bacterium]|nr:hypothetical protein [Verrucomicrobiota bacterium]
MLLEIFNHRPLSFSLPQSNAAGNQSSFCGDEFYSLNTRSMAYCAGMKKSFWHGAFWFVFALAFFIQSARAVETPPKIYRMKQWEEAKKRAIAEDKPIAWIGAPARCLAPYQKNLLGKGSHAATKYAIHTLEKEAILIFSDAETENHQEPRIVDQALHSPDPHYNIPGVIILT